MYAPPPKHRLLFFRDINTAYNEEKSGKFYEGERKMKNGIIEALRYEAEGALKKYNDELSYMDALLAHPTMNEKQIIDQLDKLKSANTALTSALAKLHGITEDIALAFIDYPMN